MRSIVIIGSGNLAEALALAVCEHPTLELRQLMARNPERGAQIAAQCRCPWSSDPHTLATADLYLIAVSDSAIAQVAASLPIPTDSAIVHTAGGIGIEALPDRLTRRGVFYPLQTFTRGRRVDFSRIPIFVEGNTEAFTQELETFARQLSHTVYRADSERRARLHLAAVFACNFTNHLYTLGEEILHEADLPFEVLTPLIEETTSKAIDSKDPRRVQTGPAVRHDLPTMQKHGTILENKPHLKSIYESLSQSIWETSKKTL